MRIVPVAGRRVRDPETRRVLGDDGLVVDPHSTHWARAIADGDVEAVADEPAPAGDAAAPDAAAPATPAEEPAHG